MIKLQNITFSYKQESILKNFNLSISSGKTTVLIGPSGCGKSTILRLINRLILPSSGEIFIKKDKVDNSTIQSLRLKMGYVIQEGGLFPNLSAAQNVCLMATRLKWEKKKIKERLEELADLTHFSKDNYNRFPGQLSGGQRQRVSLMRALMLNPDILLLDEPFGALDPIIRSGLHDSMLEIFRSLKKTVLMVSHDLHEAAYLGDDIVLMNNGQAIQSGTIEDLLKNPVNTFVSEFIRAQRSHLPELGDE
ncbi:MAG: ABC transporter ATP-binding protein [Calditrichaeota bacterium]|nr:MAG: ABC transporter ATP-binding protein [Calditrichota bacterium]MBL1204507.1 ABC transporter ATP-binding protein [Calditrichota bacterium]NOG44336.1 ABC transporter ATP-binding protein [Calditrichota bacterium]